MQTCVQTCVRHAPRTVGIVSVRAFEWVSNACLYGCLYTVYTLPMFRLHCAEPRPQNLDSDRRVGQVSMLQVRQQASSQPFGAISGSSPSAALGLARRLLPCSSHMIATLGVGTGSVLAMPIQLAACMRCALRLYVRVRSILYVRVWMTCQRCPVEQAEHFYRINQNSRYVCRHAYRHVPWTVGTVSTRAFKWYMAYVCRMSICMSVHMSIHRTRWTNQTSRALLPPNPSPLLRTSTPTTSHCSNPCARTHAHTLARARPPPTPTRVRRTHGRHSHAPCTRARRHAHDVCIDGGGGGSGFGRRTACGTVAQVEFDTR